MVVDSVNGHLWSGSMDGIRVWDPTPPPDQSELLRSDGKETSDAVLASEMALTPEEREKREAARKRAAEQHQHIVALSRAKSANSIQVTALPPGSTPAAIEAAAAANSSASGGPDHVDADCLFLLAGVSTLQFFSLLLCMTERLTCGHLLRCVIR